ncbi:N-acetyltransferase [Desulfobacula toluolica]|uniref:GCN5-related N-acetyltransferase n=1 Tax=Desulfobacula toluolica (strain DSM 7467 / Tol2) TaxID=651182 RepID=K0NRS5_DESTT|nr:N-acetyltransferase [Desulfobacula toluolica]CCK81657.1 GCN5-related N-acetyltransferase [Desulfobacula toluolica Tol2]
MIRKAVLDDVKHIHALLQFYHKTGELLARPLSKLYDHLRDFWVFEDPRQNKVVGCCALQFCWENMAEIRSLAVDPDFTGQGIGTVLTERTIQEAVYFKITDLFTLTYRPTFFERFEFSIIDKNELPIKVWSDCIGCVNFPNCDEIAMLKKL